MEEIKAVELVHGLKVTLHNLFHLMCLIMLNHKIIEDDYTSHHRSNQSSFSHILGLLDKTQPPEESNMGGGPQAKRKRSVRLTGAWCCSSSDCQQQWDDFSLPVPVCAFTIVGVVGRGVLTIIVHVACCWTATWLVGMMVYLAS